MTSAARARNDPVLLQLGPDPLRPGYDPAAAAAACSPTSRPSPSARRCSTRR